jgi:ribosome biogenesis GTPase
MRDEHSLNTEQRVELRQKLAALDARARKDLIRQASSLRQRAQATETKEAKRPVEWFMLHLLTKAEAQDPVGVVVGVDRTRCIVRVDDTELACRAPEGLAPGDAVRVANESVTEVLPRFTTLHRKEVGGARLIAANVEVVVVVVSVVAPPLHPRLIDRYLAAINRGGAAGAICLNKADLGVSREDEEAIAMYRGIVPVFETSAGSGLGIAELREFLGNRLAALVGHSGVGKSSVLNALLEMDAAEAGSVSDDTGKGRHTTTRSTLHEMAGLRLLDTPGIREFAVAFESPHEVSAGFAEIDRVGASCRFADCLHVSGNSCAVRRAVTMGTIRSERYESYLKLLEEAFPDVTPRFL